MPEVATESKRGAIALLMLVLSGVIALVVVIPSDSGSDRFLGRCLAAIGVINILLRRKISRSIFDQIRLMPSIFSNFWKRIGRDGVQFLYLGIGIILVLAGLFLVVRSANIPSL